MISLSYIKNHDTYKLENKQNKLMPGFKHKNNIYKMQSADNFEDSKLLI